MGWMKKAACDCRAKPRWPTVTKKWAAALPKAKDSHRVKASIARESVPRVKDSKVKDAKVIALKANAAKEIEAQAAAEEAIVAMIGVAVVARREETTEAVAAAEGAGTDTSLRRFTPAATTNVRI